MELLRAASRAVRIPVIASGGAGSQKDILDGLTIGQADAALLAELLHFGQCKIDKLKKYLKMNGVAVRV
ncbi:MAG: HisA/HisF-related TIM barrel protein [Patescibacteria group bacterium]